MKDYSNYHNTNYTDKLLRDGVKTFERSLKVSPDSYSVMVDGVKKEVMIQSTSNYNERRILFKKDDIDIGDLIDHDSRKWLVTEIPFFNKIHSKSHMIMCTQTLSIPTTSRLIEYGKDNLGRPITKEVPGTPITLPCVVQSSSEQLNERDMDGRINFPDGKIDLFIQYNMDSNIHIGKELEIFEQKYRIYGINRSRVIDRKGILVLHCDKIQ